jgi:hypothetical protein
MRRLLGSFACAAALLPFAPPALGPTSQEAPLALRAEAPAQPLRAGKPVVLQVTVTNTSDRDIVVPISQGTGDVALIYRVHVLDERGRPAPPRVPPPPREGGPPPTAAVSIHSIGLQPGKSLTDEVNVSYIYDLRPGKYKVWVTEPFYRGPNTPNGMVKSNTVTVTVVK